MAISSLLLKTRANTARSYDNVASYLPIPIICILCVLCVTVARSCNCMSLHSNAIRSLTHVSMIYDLVRTIVIHAQVLKPDECAIISSEFPRAQVG